MKKLSIFLLTSALLAGCSTVPETGESVPSVKQLQFPPESELATAKKGEVLYFFSEYLGAVTYKFPVPTKVTYKGILLSYDVTFDSSVSYLRTRVNEQDVVCSERMIPVTDSVLFRADGDVCFPIDKDGVSSTALIRTAGQFHFLSNDLARPVALDVDEQRFNHRGPTELEFLVESIEANQVLLAVKKLEKGRLTKKIVPLIVDSVPKTVVVENVQLKINSLTKDGFAYQVVKGLEPALVGGYLEDRVMCQVRTLSPREMPLRSCMAMRGKALYL